MPKKSNILPFRPRPARTHPHQTLDLLVEEAALLDPVYREDLSFGDWVIVKTRNSTYTISVVDDETYLITGGWFDEHEMSPVKMTINGCTWGGRAIMRDVLATPGLLLEFGNNVTTTRIQDVQVHRHGEPLSTN